LWSVFSWFTFSTTTQRAVIRTKIKKHIKILKCSTNKLKISSIEGILINVRKGSRKLTGYNRHLKLLMQWILKIKQWRDGERKKRKTM
jgi:hypothetical protein